MAATPGERQRRPLGVILIVELWGRLEGPAAWHRRSLETQVREAVEHFDAFLPESYLPAHPDVLGEEVADISRLLTGPLADGIEMQSIPIPVAHEAQLLPVDEIEYNIFIENAASIGNSDPPINEDHVQGLNLEVLELVRARKVRKIRAYCVIKTVPGPLGEFMII